MQRVYCIGWQEIGPVKVGIASDVQRRIRELQPGSPFTLLEFYSEEMKGHQWTDKDCRHLENVIHERLRFVRLTGEWFACPVMDAIRLIQQTIAHASSMVGRSPTAYGRMRIKKHEYWYRFPVNDRGRRGPIDWKRVR